MTTYTALLIKELSDAGTYQPGASECSAADAIHGAFQDAVTTCVSNAWQYDDITTGDLIWRMACVGIDVDAIVSSLDGHRAWTTDEIAMLMAGGVLDDLTNHFEETLACMSGGEQE